MIYNFHALNIDTNGRTSGRIKTICPNCRERRSDKRDKSLSVDLDTGLYHCHYCDWSGKADDGSHSGYASRKVGDPLVKGSPVAACAPKRPLPPPAVCTPLTDAQLHWFTTERRIPAEVLTAMGITSSVQKMPPAGASEACICFNYYEDGELVNTKYRTLDKHFKMVPGAELIPYHIDAIRNTAACIITEGEIDAASFVAVGRNDVVSVPSGANSNLTYLDRFMESHFEDKRIIYLAVDTDTKGKALCRELLRRFGAERCRVVTYGDGCKDANELLVKSGSEALVQALADAPEQPLEGVYSATDVADELRELFENECSHGAESGLEEFDKLCTFELGRLCVVTGHPGHGKSEFVDELCLRLCLRHGWRIGYFSPENLPLVYHLRKLVEKLTGQKFKRGFTSEPLYRAAVSFLTENVASILPGENFTLDSILRRARELVSRRGTRILVIDPYNRVEHQIPAGQTETQYISAMLDKLFSFAVRNNCLVILVAHPAKMTRDPGTRKDPVPTLQNINGSAAFANKCDFGLVVERDREVGVTRVYVRKVKFRHLGNIGEAAFVFNTTNGRYSPCREAVDDPDPKRRVQDTKFDQTPWVKAEEEKDLFS